MSEFPSRAESRSSARSAVEGDAFMEAASLRILGRSPAGRALSFALLGFGAHPTTPAAPTIESKVRHRRTDVSERSRRHQQEGNAVQSEGPDVEAIASAWDVPNAFYRVWLHTSFPVELSDPTVLRAIRIESDHHAAPVLDRGLSHDHAHGSIESAVLQVEEGIPVLSLFPDATEADPAHPRSEDRRFDDVIRTKYHALVRLLAERVSSSAKEAAARFLLEAQARFPQSYFAGSVEQRYAHARRDSIDVNEWFATIGEEACRQSYLDTDVAFKAAIVDRVLTRTRVQGVQAHQDIVKSVDLFFECLEEAYPDFSFRLTAHERHRGVEEMRRGYRVSCVKRSLHLLEACEDLEERTKASFDRPDAEWSLVERMLRVPESKISAADLEVVRQVILAPEEQVIATREASEAIRKGAHPLAMRDERGVYTALMDGMTHGHGQKHDLREAKSIDRALVAWDHLRAELRALRHGLRSAQVVPRMTRDDFSLHYQALTTAVGTFTRLWQQIPVHDRRQLHPALQALDRLYEGEDHALTSEQRACFERILASV